MTRISHNDSIEGRGRSLHLQTHTVEESRKIISTLFEGGRVLSKLEDRYDGSLPETDLREQVEKVHRERINEIELLYAITVKIQTVRHAASLTKLGNQYLRWNLLDEAISELELALQYDPKHGEAYLYLGEAYLRRGGQAEAVRILKKGMKNSPSYADMRLRLGLAHLGGGAFSDALRSFREALALNKEYAEAHFCIALCMIAVVVGDVREKGIPEPMECRKRAWEHLSRAVSLSGRFRTPEVEEILRRLHQGDLKAALTLFRTVHRALPPTIDLNFHVDEKEGFPIFGWKIPEKWGISTHWELESGKRYTQLLDIEQEIYDTANPYSKMAKYWHQLDFRIYKYFDIMGMNFSLLIQVENALDAKIPRIINPYTGREYRPGDILTDESTTISKSMILPTLPIC